MASLSLFFLRCQHLSLRFWNHWIFFQVSSELIKMDIITSINNRYSFSRHFDFLSNAPQYWRDVILERSNSWWSSFFFSRMFCVFIFDFFSTIQTKKKEEEKKSNNLKTLHKIIIIIIILIVIVIAAECTEIWLFDCFQLRFCWFLRFSFRFFLAFIALFSYEYSL